MPMAKEELWFQAVEQEESEQLALALVDEVVQRTQTVLFERRLQSQLIPFAVDCAKQSMLETIRVMWAVQGWAECAGRGTADS